jgi:5-methyltetrahydropteroyltriglutamate--homocysteine methyltransferase
LGNIGARFDHQGTTMRRSTDRILTTHVGALPAPHDVWAQLDVGDERLAAAVVEVCEAQRLAGVDFINEGELTKGGHWTEYLASRLEGYEPAGHPGALGDLLLSSTDWVEFRDFYLAVLANGTLFEQSGSAQHVPEGAEETAQAVEDWVCTSPVHYRGQAALEREIAMLTGALGDTPLSDAFLTTTAPLSVEPGRDKGMYGTDEEHIYAIAEAMQVEYEAIAASGLQVQVDDAWLGALWDRIGIPMGLDDYRKFCQMRCEALNHALRNIPEEQIRYHLCWGSWHGPHSADLPLPDVVDIMLSIKAQTYSIEAANVRHEHEVELWQETKLPEGKILAPGVVTHSTPLIEHPQLVANRIVRFAELVGRENVIASTDCGLGLRLHPSLAWAKLRVLVEGAKLASETLWGE